MKKFILFLVALIFTVACDSAPEEKLNKTKTLFKTQLIKKTKSPQSYKEETPPANAQEVYYQSGNLRLKAWLSSQNTIGKSPAVVFLHGGFAFSSVDWEDAYPFVESGFILMMPMLRGENGNPGNFEMFGGEVKDVIAAGKYLRSLPQVDPKRIFVIGHSVGGSLAIQTSQQKSPYKIAVGISGYPKLNEFLSIYQKLVPFDINNEDELAIRNPIIHADETNIPLHLYAESDNSNMQLVNKNFNKQLMKLGKKSTYETIEGNHYTIVFPAIQKSILLFKNYKVN